MRRVIAGTIVGAIVALGALIVLPAPVRAAPVAPYSWLPYQYGYAHDVWQGNNVGTHTVAYDPNGVYAWDFGGSWIVRASMGGSVSLIKDSSTLGGCNQIYANDANFVKVYSGDGYERLYLHLAYGSVSGRIGLHQNVDRYQPIGVSGDTGWACGAHLHFQVQNPCPGFSCPSVPSSFLDQSVLNAHPLDGVPVAGDPPSAVSSYNSSFAMLVAENSQYTWMARGNHLQKYDMGGTGQNMFSGSHFFGSYDMGTQITALAVNETYLLIGLDTGRVIKTDMCDRGNNPCHFSDAFGSGTIAGYTNWQGVQDFSTQAGITSLAANANYLYVGFDVGVGASVSRVVKTNLCGTGQDMCALRSYTDGTCCWSQTSYWQGYQDWSTSVGAIAINGAYSYTSLAVRNNVCKDDNVGTGQNMFYLSDWPSSCTGGTAGHYFGYEGWTQAPVSLAADSSHVWWSVAGTPRLVETNNCGTAANICALSDGIGSGSLPNYTYWLGRQDWCGTYESSGVTVNTLYVDSAFYLPSGAYRIVQGSVHTSGGTTMFTGDCTGTSGSSYWLGYQDLNI